MGVEWDGVWSGMEWGRGVGVEWVGCGVGWGVEWDGVGKGVGVEWVGCGVGWGGGGGEQGYKYMYVQVSSKYS